MSKPPVVTTDIDSDAVPAVPQPLLGRRQFLGGAAAAMLAACGGGGSGAEGSPDPGPPAGGGGGGGGGGSGGGGGGSGGGGGGPPPAAPEGAYRYTQRYLFQPIPSNNIAPRLAGSSGFYLNTVGPKRTQVGSGWFWDNPGGDWIDANNARMGSVPWASVAVNGASGANGANYSVSVTALVQKCQVDKRWLALLLNLSANDRYIATPEWPTASERPRIDVTYSDGTTAVLACRIVAFNTASSALPDTLGPERLLPAFMEFERPAKPVQSATFSFRLTQHYGGNANARLWLLDPPINSAPVQQGLAGAQALDAGLVGNAQVIHVHRYLDGAARGDFFYGGPSIGSWDRWSTYDPAITGLGATDTSRFPHVGLGKWLGAPPEAAPRVAGGGGTWQLVPSSYKGEGFQPLAPGLGAIRMFMSRGIDVLSGQPLADGGIDGGFGQTGADARIMLPEADFGRLDEIYVRYYWRIGTIDGGPYTEPSSGVLNVWRSASGPSGPDWTSLGGKWGLMPCHAVTAPYSGNFGGVSGQSGGQYGFQARMSHNSAPIDIDGPVSGGWTIGWHNYDFLSYNPRGNYQVPSYNFGDPGAPQADVSGSMGFGGLAPQLYAHRWYCMESCMKLNTILPYYPGFLPDGRLRVWVDGRLAKDFVNTVFRVGPPYRGHMSATHMGATYGPNQFAEAAVSGMAAGTGYAGVCVRHNNANDGLSVYYQALVSRKDAATAVIGLRRRYFDTWTHLAQCELPWADGDVLRLEAVGSNPTVLTVKKNGIAVTLQWWATVNNVRTAQSGASYSDAQDSFHRGGGYVGIAGEVNDRNNGLWLDNWSGGQIGGAAASDAFAYGDGALASVSSGAWSNKSSVGPALVAGGRVRANDAGVIDATQRSLPFRSLGFTGVWFNLFHGGTTQNNRDRVMFMTGVAVARSYIGPMKLA